MNKDSCYTELTFSEYSELNSLQKSQLILLWNNEYPANIRLQSNEAFDKYLSSLKDKQHILATTTKNEIIAWYVDFLRENERWFAMIIDSKYQRRGIGSKLIRKAKTKNLELNGWVVDSNKYLKANGQLYKSPLAFYNQNGFITLETQRFETEILSTVKITWKNKQH
jgi:GNAT superfamily N-acetyltransferase